VEQTTDHQSEPGNDEGGEWFAGVEGEELKIN
jgi:hypothetical protein